MKILKPFVKWAGGKNQLLPTLRGIYPAELGGSVNKYAEPFVGGGAVLFDILSRYSLEELYISDTNAELINAYRIIKLQHEKLIPMLNVMQNEYVPLGVNDRKLYYYEKRRSFNDIKVSGDEAVNIEKAALFIFLNKTCFNGLYRVNRNGMFNVPMGAYKSPCICDEENLKNISSALENVKIVCGDYRKSEEFIDRNTFVYFDPPYRPLTETASFTAYTESVFDDRSQFELAEYVELLAERGARIAVSNSDPKNTDINDDFFDNLYKKHNIKRVQATRMINCNSDSRGKINELLITNYGAERDNTMNRSFGEWLSTFKTSIADYGYYVDFKKVYENVDKIKVELNILNSLIGSKSIEKEFISLTEKYPEVLKCIPLLLAVRKSEIYAVDGDGEFTYSFNKSNQTPRQYCIFMRKTGLFELLEKHIINNLYDYATGVETGLDSNGRKNRGGHLMENIVEDYIKKSGFVKGESYFKEMGVHKITEKWGADLSAVSNSGKTEKRFDYVIKTDNQIYVIETNCYSGGGSKLNETARSYKQLAQELDTIDGVTFVWFTDGAGWAYARHNLEETFDIMPHIYNINDLENGIINEVFK